MNPAVAIGLVVVVAAFLGWWLWAARRRRRAGGGATEPRDAWDALNRGIDPSELEEPGELGPAADGAVEQSADEPPAEPETDSQPR